ncbi:transcriptional regulator [Yersinia ruckeri]|uniref:transcriptional regulator n=1 Tax=Yersinia ruckeri TaxID=29486 RepID=UPI0008FD9BED|nr:YdaS family helix-turn-helix protein [Yersinia ruckeri]EKN4197670.1 helix-turn-helix domain-containing protein [Yersinia ruckeri]EKN4203922.1 helix-turn-helix domain-containing protein [Yersinia ruckeri]EKN4701082.1 helix-turn-helix domain-containing protein [Yersinia ruckeri]MCK8539869.1 helix-turn-helix domain-containing protein [Yersinia ruckeri]MCK8572479.1 helix-turn-helix domain-containing protein [Yersinia ruckeri]
MAFKCKNITDEAIRAVGSLSAVSRRFEFKSVQSVANWIINNQVPADRVIQLCAMGQWKITPHQLRPDIYPNPRDGMPVTDAA